MINPTENPRVLNGVQHHHLLWALTFLKVYGTENVMRRLCGNPDEKTYRKWIWIFVIEIANLYPHVIRWEDRLLGARPGQTSFVTIDGTDCPTHDSRNPFWKGWWSKKFNGPGLRYEVAVAINTPNIVWTNGPFPPRSFPDGVVFCDGLMQFLLPGETVEADKGYIGLPNCNTPHNYYNDLQAFVIQEKLRAQHETVNKYIKKFAVTRSFRHDLSKHELCMWACVVLTQLGLHNGEPIFEVKNQHL